MPEPVTAAAGQPVPVATGGAVPAVRFRGVSKSFGAVHVLRDVDLEVPAGQKLAIIGPSGSGKTTLLRLLMTLEQPERGSIEIDGELLGAERRDGQVVRDETRRIRDVRAKIGMVFQHFNLFPHMTALGNVMEGPVHVNKVDRTEAERAARDLLELVGLAVKADSYPRQLSGGQQQRVAIARAFAMRPRVMLCGDVTDARDPELVGEVLRVVRDLAHQESMTMLIVTHEMAFAEDISDRVIFMDHGVIVEDAAPEVIFHSPAHERTKSFLRAVLER
ncbi:ectoine/hydroxyectoine ABC transporter ATP-binding protein EhuA [soil metagenome]